jgi:hypothetical protein
MRLVFDKDENQEIGPFSVLFLLLLHFSLS